jgi:hypothetical protein
MRHFGIGKYANKKYAFIQPVPLKVWWTQAEMRLPCCGESLLITPHNTRVVVVVISMFRYQISAK